VTPRFFAFLVKVDHNLSAWQVLKKSVHGNILGANIFTFEAINTNLGGINGQGGTKDVPNGSQIQFPTYLKIQENQVLYRTLQPSNTWKTGLSLLVKKVKSAFGPSSPSGGCLSPVSVA